MNNKKVKHVLWSRKQTCIIKKITTCQLIRWKSAKYNLFIADLLNFIKTARYISNFDN